MAIPVTQMARFFSENGQKATLREFTAAGETETGKTKYTTTETEITVIRSFVTNTRTPFIDQTPGGEQRIGDYEFYVLEDEWPDVDLLPVDKLPQIDFGGVTYEIQEQETPGIGVTRLVARKHRK